MSDLLSEYQMISIIRNGLNKTEKPHKIVIVGAGMAGLVAASLLKQAGHDVKILEATQRVGGRVYTVREPFTEGHYIDMGPMRIPNIHYLTLEYIRKFGLPVNPFINTSPNDIIYVNGVKTRQKIYERNPAIVNYPVWPHEKGKTLDTLLHTAFQPIYHFINKNPETNWGILIKELDKYSLDTFLRHNPFGVKLSLGAIEQIKVFTANEGLSELSFLEIFREFFVLINPRIRFFEITGGNDHLPRAFLAQLKNDIFFEQEVKKIVQRGNKVIVHAVHTRTGKPFKLVADYAIFAVPFSVLRYIEVEPRNSFSHEKWKAIRELHYVQSIKMGIQFNNRFWEKDGMYGGRLITDLPIRQAYYPSHGFDQKSGVLLASYTWEDDAASLARFPPEEQVEYALNHLTVIHGEHILDHFVTGISHNWVTYRYSSGAFAMFKPGQETELYPSIISPEGRVHFAGEHASLQHGWIQGAIESGIRAAYEVNHRH